MPEGVPPEVIRSFEALIPGAVILTLALLLRVGMEHTSFGTIHDFVYKVLAVPLKSLGTSYIGSMFTVLATKKDIYTANIENVVFTGISNISFQFSPSKLAIPL